MRPVPDEFVPLYSGNQRLGVLSPDFALRVRHEVGTFSSAGPGLRLNEALSGEVLTSRWRSVAEDLCSEGWFSAWRNEDYDVRLDDGDDGSAVLCRLERGVFRRFGLRSRAVHVNGVTPDGRMWIARRSADKAVDPGLLDNIVGGGIASGESPAATLLRECAEEAGIGHETARLAVSAGVLHARRVEEEGVHDEFLHVFALRLPEGFVPRNTDGEVAGFRLVDAEELAARILAGELTEDAAAVASCWLLETRQ